MGVREVAIHEGRERHAGRRERPVCRRGGVVSRIAVARSVSRGIGISATGVVHLRSRRHSSNEWHWGRHSVLSSALEV